MLRRQSTSKSFIRAPGDLHAWLIGSGIASLTAAVHLIKDAQVPGSRVHILETRSVTGGGVENTGNASNGYVVFSGRHPNLHDVCMGELLSQVPSAEDPAKTILESLKESNANETLDEETGTRVLAEGKPGLEEMETRRLGVSLKDRMDLIMIMIEGEKILDNKSIEDLFGHDFFKTKFWTVFSVTFGFQPWHSAIEFRRYLRKFIHNIPSLNNLGTAERTRYTQNEFIITPITNFLKEQGVDFRFDTKVTDILTYPEGDPTTVSEIKMTQRGTEKIVTVDANDIVIITLGSINSGSQQGTNNKPPPTLADTENLLNDQWRLWSKLSKKSMKFGNPENFYSRVPESRLLTFTITTQKAPEFFSRLLPLTCDKRRRTQLLSLKDSNWILNLSVPNQPIFQDQPKDVHVFWGYAMSPEREGNFVKKPMMACSGEEILMELLQHLHFPVDFILKNSITIPCLMPFVTAELLTRGHGDRPEVIPHNMTNLALVGQFVEIPDDTTFTMDYSVRGAQMAVYRLMGLKREPQKSRSYISEFLDLLI
ncbi:hypothetical protein Egran_06416 [Elaphomyces granulatus]|uniref:Oleate hydratase n=1 Tax=Elaphomyces granulatus TaxID=519963 RepID=A0A232LNU7_9EURO|nr:hypothetical protein Egran_06416 [Elaphomyces granulatus]